MSNPSSLPSSKVIEEATELDLFNLKGEKVKFGTIFEQQKAIVVFIRHFFCGKCQAYVNQLASVPTKSLEDANAKIYVIGCGEWSAIEAYKEITGFKGEIYADPTRSLYKALGMNIENLGQTPADQKKRTYLTKGSYGSSLAASLWRILKNPGVIGSQGNFSQLGGDFVFGPGKECLFANRMQHTEDHAEVSDLMKEAGVQFP